MGKYLALRILITALVSVLLIGCGDDILWITLSEPVIDGVPVELHVPLDGNVSSEASWSILPEGGKPGDAVPAQILDRGDSEGGNVLVFMPGDGVVWHSEKVRVRAINAEKKTVSPFVILDDGNSTLALTENDDPVLTYIYGRTLADDVPADRARSCYIHPLYGIDGEILTADFPPDHHHHRGLFLAWPQVIVRGDTLDLWHIHGIKKRFEQINESDCGPVFALLTVQAGWYVGDEKVVEERMLVRPYRKGTVGRAVDVEIALNAVSDSVTINGSPSLRGYGGFNIRPAPFSDPVITAGGDVQPDSDLRRFPWADFSACFGGRAEYSGYSIFDHIDNLNTPNGWCLRHYGFLGVEWPGNNPYLLRPGIPLTLTYRIWTHRGNATEGRAADAYHAWSGSRY